MTQATSNASRPKGSVGEKDSSNSAAAAPRRSQTPSRQDQKNGTGGNSNSSAGATKGKMMSNARSTSAPKQRGRSSTGPSSSGSLPPPPSRYEVALARMKKESEGKSDEELQFLLQQLLQNAQFEDAAYLISASAYLDAKFKTSDVVRLMLEAKQFDQTAQLIRDMKLQSNQLLVTLFVKELVRCSQFHAAVRYAQEMVQNFGKKDFGPRDQERPSWTPQALIQAMLRAFQFKTALKFSKQFDLLDTFPALPLVANMFEARQWEDAISSVMEYRLFTDFPIEALIMKMLGERQWSLAVKCMGKIQQKELLDKYADALVREAARAGDFIVALRYLREYKLDQAENKPLLQFLVDAMITFGEMYKAIKYAIKFGLDKEDPEGEETGATPYATKKLIAKAIEIGQFHIATTYIKKLRLKDQFGKELGEMQQKQQTRLREFREFVSFREAQFNHPTAQHQLYALIGDKIAADAMDIVELDPVSVDMVLSEVEEIVPRKKREVAEQKAEESVLETTSSSHDVSLQSSTERQSRFNFARTSVPDIQPPSLPPGITATQNSESSQQERTHAPPPGLAQFAQPVAPVRTEESSSSFNFAQFASALHSNAPPAPVPSPTHAQSLPMPPGMQHQQMQQNQQSAPMYAQHAPMLSNHFGRGPIPPPPSFAPSYHQGSYAMQSMNPNQAPPPLPSYMMPPPPSVPSQQQYPSGNGNPGMDIASLAMQFHSSGNGRGFGAPSGFGMNNQGGAPVSYPPQMPPNAPSSGAPPALNHLFPSFVPPPPPPQFAPPPRSSFKPSIGYTSVTTTRQKK